MGMLLTYHPGYRGEDTEADAEVDRPLERQNKEQLQATAADLGLDTDGTKAELRERITAHQSGGEPEGWAALSDDQLAEAYATNVDPEGEFPGRDAAVEALAELDAEQPDNG